MTTTNNILPPPKEGEEIYVPRAVYGEPGVGLETGGRAKVRRVIQSSCTHIIYCEDIAPVFHWDLIAPEQEELKAKFGDKFAAPKEQAVRV